MWNVGAEDDGQHGDRRRWGLRQPESEIDRMRTGARDGGVSMMLQGVLQVILGKWYRCEMLGQKKLGSMMVTEKRMVAARMKTGRREMMLQEVQVIYWGSGVGVECWGRRRW